MSSERKLLRAIIAMEAKSTEGEQPLLSQVMVSVGVPSTVFRELLTQLLRKGYVTTEWRATPAGRRVATRPLGQVLLRRQPRGRQHESGTNIKTKTRRVFPASQPQMPSPLSEAVLSHLRSNRNGTPLDEASPPQMLQGQQRTPPALAAHSQMEELESFVDVRESELQELKPH